jgi:hypothetical protein
VLGYFIVAEPHPNEALTEIIKIVDNNAGACHIEGSSTIANPSNHGFLYSHNAMTPLFQGYWYTRTLSIYSARYIRFVVNNNWWVDGGNTFGNYTSRTGVDSYIFASMILNQGLT